jgi:hypothetical protein
MTGKASQRCTSPGGASDRTSPGSDWACACSVRGSRLKNCSQGLALSAPSYQPCRINPSAEGQIPVSIR